MDTKEEHIQELRRLKDLSTVPSVQKVLENLINENRKMREPIKRSKVHFIHWGKVPMKMLNNVYTQQAQIQTIYITTGYAWSQTSTYIRYVSSKSASWHLTKRQRSIYVNFKDAGKLSKDNCSMNTTTRSVEFNIASIFFFLIIQCLVSKSDSTHSIIIIALIINSKSINCTHLLIQKNLVSKQVMMHLN